MKNFKYLLEPYHGMKTRYCCPRCRKENVFSRYINANSGEYLDVTVGRCNREINCGYHYPPKQYLQDKNISAEKHSKITEPNSLNIIPEIKPYSQISIEIFKNSLNAGSDIKQIAETNHFIGFLINQFGVELTSKLTGRYFIGTYEYWSGATVFWQIDGNGKIRTGKIMLYDPSTGKRIKQPFSYINWVHKTEKIPDFVLKQCLFGEHLLIDKSKPVAIVESEKTAIIASAYLPRFIWLAVGSLSNLSIEMCKILKGRKIILFPDLKGFEKWTNKAKELSDITEFVVSDLLEHKATEQEREQGLDIADYLLRFELEVFQKNESKKDMVDKSKTLNINPEYNKLEQGFNDSPVLKSCDYFKNSTSTENKEQQKMSFGTYEWAAETKNIISGCIHDCKYCYAKSMAVRFNRKTPENWKDEEVNLKKLSNNFRKRKGRVMFPSSHDISPENAGYSIIFLNKLLKSGSEVLVVTKPHLSVIQEFCRKFADAKDQILFRFTIGSCNTETLKFWEPGAPSFEERFECLKLAFHAGFQTSVSSEPALDTNTIELVEILLPFVTDAIWIGLPNDLLKRLRFNGADDTETLTRAEELMYAQSNDWVKDLYGKYCNNPKIKWKDSMKKILELERPAVNGLDI